MSDFSTKIFIYLVVVLSAILHEYAHAWAALRAGDPTAKYEGRLTLNPLAHLDAFGTVLLPLLLLFSGGFFVGYAKPVPINPYNFKNQRRGLIQVSLAGVTANLALGLIFSFLFVLFLSNDWGSVFFQSLLSLVAYVNIILAIFNLIPIPPLDGSKLLQAVLPPKLQLAWVKLSAHGAWAGIIVALMIAFFVVGPLAKIVFSLFVRLADLIF